MLSLNDQFELQLTPTSAKKTKAAKSDVLICPKCKKGEIIKGKTAYGCSEYKNGCDFRYTFEDVRKQAADKPLTKELVVDILSGNN